MIAWMPQPGDTNYVRCDSDNTTDSMTFYGHAEPEPTLAELKVVAAEESRSAAYSEPIIRSRPQAKAARAVKFNGKRKFVG